MKTFFANLFEPLWFVLLMIVMGVKMLDPAFRRSWRQLITEHRTGRRFVVLMRWTSKRMARSMPFVMPSLLLVGSVLGASAAGIGGALAGAAAMLVLVIAVPLLMPMPSVAIERAGLRG